MPYSFELVWPVAGDLSTSASQHIQQAKAIMERLGNDCSRLIGHSSKLARALLCTSSRLLRWTNSDKWNYFRFDCASLASAGERQSVLELRQKGLVWSEPPAPVVYKSLCDFERPCVYCQSKVRSLRYYFGGLIEKDKSHKDYKHSYKGLTPVDSASP